MNPSSGLRVSGGKWRRTGVFLSSLVVLFLTAGPGPVVAAPPLRGTPAGAAPRSASAAGLAVDGLPSFDTQPAASDLLLKKEDIDKGDALAAFAEGILAEFSDEGSDPDKAFEAYQRAFNLDPGYTELAVKIAYEFARRGDVASGINALKDAIKYSPKEPLPYLYLSQLYAKYLKKPEVGQKYAQQALDLNPNNFAAYLALYEIYSDLGQQKKADATIDRALKLENKDVQFWLQLGEFYTRLLLKDDGSTAPEEIAKLNAVYQKALPLAAENAEALTKVADFYARSGQVKEAIPLYLKVIGLKSASRPDATLASVRDKLAKSFRAAGQRDEAIAMLQKLIKENPLRYETYELLAELFEEKNDMEGALLNYQQTLLLNPGQPLNHLRVGEMQFRLKKYDKAIETLTEARKRFPGLPQITYLLAISLSQAKQHQPAITAFEEAVHEAENTQQDMLNGQFYFTFGAAAEQAGLPDKAAELLQKSIELDPGGSTLGNPGAAYNYLGYMWTDRGEKLDEASDLIRRALEMEPENPAYIDSMGWWYFKKGEPQKAVEFLEKAASTIQPEDAVVFDHLGDAHAAMNDIPKALIFWKKAAALEPENKTFTDKIERAKQKLASHKPAAAPASAEAAATATVSPAAVQPAE